MSNSVVLFLSIIGLLIILLSSLSFVYADSSGLDRPITSKVIPSNFSAIDSGGSESFYRLNPIITSKVIPSNYTITPTKASPSYTVTNATITFLLNRVLGDSHKAKCNFNCKLLEYNNFRKSYSLNGRVYKNKTIQIQFYENIN